MKFRCRNGHNWRSAEFRPRPGEQICPECGGIAESTLSTKGPSNGLRRDAETPAHRAAREEFNRLVSEWPCWAREHRAGHKCWGPLDCHHLIPKSWIQDNFGDLPEPELLAFKFNPIIGAPVCRRFHEGLESRSELIHFHELDEELVLYAKELESRYPDRPSPLKRLEEENPIKNGAVR